MKLFVGLFILLSFLGLSTLNAELKFARKVPGNTRATKWVFDQDKTINDIVHKENGKIISVVLAADSFVTFLQTPNDAYRCTDLFSGSEEVTETACFKLAKP